MWLKDMNFDIMWRTTNQPFEWFLTWTLASLGLWKGVYESAGAVY